MQMHREAPPLAIRVGGKKTYCLTCTLSDRAWLYDSYPQPMCMRVCTYKLLVPKKKMHWEAMFFLGAFRSSDGGSDTCNRKYDRQCTIKNIKLHPVFGLAAGGDSQSLAASLRERITGTLQQQLNIAYVPCPATARILSFSP